MVDWRGVPPGPSPITQADLDSETLDDAQRAELAAELAWLNRDRSPARRRIALLLGLAVAVTVSLLAYRRFQR